MRRLLLAAAAAALLLPGQADAGRYAVGVAAGHVARRRRRTRSQRTTGTRADRKLAALRALVVDARSARALRALDGVEYVERLDTSRRVAFVPNDPIAPKQWHLEQDHAFDFWPELPALAGPRVAVIDSGIDGTHPDLVSRIAGSRSFVGGSALTDQQGHGTFVAGLIAAQTNNSVGVAGIAFPSQLLIAKVVRANRQVSLEAEADAIRWAVDNGARVINLSLGGVRDPRDAGRDTYSPLEASAVRYAYTRGVVVVAAVGNADQAPRSPWPYASYPAALPHVHRRERARQGRVRAALLEPRPDLQRPRSTGPGARLHLPAPADRAAGELPRAGLLDLRLRRLPQRGGHVLRGAAGHRRRRAPARRASPAPAGPGRAHPDALGRGRERRDGLQAVPASARHLQRLGQAQHREVARRARRPDPAGRPLRVERRRRHAGDADATERASTFRRRSTSGTTTSTCTSVYLRAQAADRRHARRPARREHRPPPLEARHAEGAGAVARAAPPARRAVGEAGDARADRVPREGSGLVLRRGEDRAARRRLVPRSATRNARAALRRARRAVRAPGCRPRRRAAARPSSRPRRRRRTPPRRSRHPGRGSRRRRRARRGGSSGP